MNYEAAFWLIAGLSMAGAALLIHALEYAVPIVARRVAGLRREASELDALEAEEGEQ